MFTFLLALFGVGICLLDFILTSYRSVPGPRRWPVVGNLLEFLGLGPVEIFERIVACSKTYGSVYKLEFLYDYTLVYSSPDAAQMILNSNNFSAKSEDYGKVSEWIGDGLLVSTGFKWKKHRDAILHGFNSVMLRNQVPVFCRYAETFCAKLATSMDDRPGEPINVLPELKLHTLGALCGPDMVDDVADKWDKLRQYTQTVDELTSILYWRMYNWFANYNTLFRLTPTSRRFSKLVTVSRKFSRDMIDQKRNIKDNFEPTSRSSEVYDEPVRKGPQAMSVMDALLNARTSDGKPLTDEEVQDEMATFTFAGYDTTASAMSFVLYNVAKYPDLQERLYDEIVAELGAECRELCLRDLNSLVYMDAFIKESLRLFPSVPVVARIATADSSLLGTQIKKGTSVALNIFTLHRDPKFYPDPERFDPERFQHKSPQDLLGVNKYAYIPFSSGLRNCIGQKFAQYEMKCTLVKVVQQFRLRLTRPDYVPSLRAEIVLMPAEGMPLKFSRRC